MRRFLFILILLVSGHNVATAQVTAQNDTAEICICNRYSVEIPVLDNDQYSCSSPVIELIPPAPANITITSNNTILYLATFVNDIISTDSFKYSITCNGISSTAMVYVHIDQYTLAPWIEFENSLDKICIKEGKDITHTCTVRNKCPNSHDIDLLLGFNNSEIEVSEGVIQTSTIGGVSNWTYSTYSDMPNYMFTLDPGAEATFITRYHVNNILSGNSPTILSYLYEFPDFLYDIDSTMVCPERTVDITSCDKDTVTSSVSNFCSISYQILQDPFINGNTAQIDAAGYFSYNTADPITYIQQDSVLYRAACSEGTPTEGWISINLLPCMDEPTISYTKNDQCNDDPCQYSGPSILINEVMISPEKHDGAIYEKSHDCWGSTELRGGEWIELYNPDKCNPVDISGYFLANATTDKSSPYCILTRNLGGGFILPPGTIIPPMGFCVMRGGNATPVNPAYLVKNGGNTVEIVFTDHLDKFCLNNGGIRFWLPNAGSWFAFYDRDGIPQDAIYWGPNTTDICSDCLPCNPGFTGTYNGPLVSLDGIPATRKTKILDYAITPDRYGLSPKRIPDGGNWAFNDLTEPKKGYCNSTCNYRISTGCNGTATVHIAGGSGNFSYLWSDNNAQTTPTATGLCEGTYCVTITDNETYLEKKICVTVTINEISCHPMIAVNDTITSSTCMAVDTLVNLLHNDTTYCETPLVKLLSLPTIPGSTASLEQDSLLHYTFPGSSEQLSDSIYYEITCETYRDTGLFVFYLKPDKPIISSLKIKENNVSFNISGGIQPYALYLNGELQPGTNNFQNLPNDSYLLYLIDAKGCVDSIRFNISLNNNVTNDTVTFTACNDIYVEIPILDNDSITQYSYCKNLDIILLTTPTLTGANITILNRKLIYQYPHANDTGNVDLTDSIQYQISCNNMQKTAWAYIYIHLEKPIITDSEVIRNNIIFSVTGGYAPYIFTLDGSVISKQPYFYNIIPGNHILYVRDEKYCTDSIHFNIPFPCEKIIPTKFFSPNNDGLNDTWVIQHIDCYKTFIIEIYDRFGKLLKRYENEYIPWDGMYLGKLMPSTDYWYVIDIPEYKDKISGHFTLINK